ncbi:unnamed protein product [Protopolystoma xenopodis]|uniref:Transcriptional adapter 2-alpha/beta-like domain-containing protein n=1 Tax=Protopolystoma xenopodis TaxID=117903 RepID=A0A3S5BLV2_9PLAT|nr:unnamed protein product [Protopolystoma xenopodis]
MIWTLKLAQVGIYTQRLCDRQRRKQIAREHGLIAHIMAHILNRRIKRNQPSNGSNIGNKNPLAETQNAIASHLTSNVSNGFLLNFPIKRGRGRPPSPVKKRQKLSIGCTGKQLTLHALGFTKISNNNNNGYNHKKPCAIVTSQSRFPPSGSWLAAPFIIQSWGSTKGHPIIDADLPSKNVISWYNSFVSRSVFPSSDTLPPAIEDYDAL